MSENAGKINQYVCGKGHRTTTINRDAGTTPFMILCRHDENSLGVQCGERAFSEFYRVNQGLAALWEWYRPTPESARKMPLALRDHVANGGLLLRSVCDRDRLPSSMRPKSIPKSILKDRRNRPGRKVRG